MPRLAAVAVVVALLLPSLARAGCDPTGADAADVTQARVAVAAACDCGAATSHGAYVRCAREAAAAAVVHRACRGVVVRCAAHSTCGRPGAVTCCRTAPGGIVSASVRASAGACRPRRGGSACIGTPGSVCDACTSGGCVVPTTTTTTTATIPTTTSTLPASTCGNGITEPPAEECDGQAICSPYCLIQVQVCCELGGACLDTSVALGFQLNSAAKQCFLAGGQATGGACVAGPTPGCPPPGGISPLLQCGTCQDQAISPTSLCCQHSGGTCDTVTVSDAQGLAGIGCDLLFGTDTVVIGTCGSDGHCVPQ